MSISQLKCPRDVHMDISGAGGRAGLVRERMLMRLTIDRHDHVVSGGVRASRLLCSIAAGARVLSARCCCRVSVVEG